MTLNALPSRSTLEQIARELVAVAPNAPIFLTRWLDTSIGESLGSEHDHDR